MFEEVGISVVLCHAIVIEDLGMRPAATKFVPRVLTAEKKENRLFASTDFIMQNQMRLWRKYYHWWPNMNIRLRSWNKSPVIGLENPFVRTAEESSPRSKQDKSVAHRFSYIKTALCVMISLQRVKQEIRNIIDNICVTSATPYAASDHLPLKMEHIECSETSAYMNQTSGNYPKENK